MNRKGKSWPLFVVAILIVLFSLTAIFGVSYTYGDTKNAYVKGASDIRFGIDIRGGVDVTFMPADDVEATDAQMAAAKTVIEDRLVGLGITDYESYVDNNKNRIIVRFPWKSDEADFNPQTAIDEIGTTAKMVFRKGSSSTGEEILSGDDVASASAAYNETEGWVAIKGIWCVPQYSNPDGYVYSDETIRRFASMKTAAPDFKIFWDEAYIVHHLTDEIIETPVLLNESKQYGTEDRVFMFTSTSKITFPGAGVSALACSEKSLAYICKRFSVMIISYDKMNQLRHVRFLKNKDGVLQHMAKHRRRLVPCFDAVKTTFAHELTPCGDIAHWTNPKGGYFISLYVMPGCAKRVAQLCKDCGLTLTGAGAAFPYGIDPQDSHLRIAPTYPSLSEVETASMLLTVCVRLAVVEKLLAE